jgi:hypothetical protein
MGNKTPQCYLGIYLSLIVLALQLQHGFASGSSESATASSGETLHEAYPASFVNYGSYSQEQCFALQENEEVDCLMQMLNTTDPPSIYNYLEYNALWEPVSCLIRNVTIGNRADDDGENILSIGI